MLRLDGVWTRRGHVQVLRDISFDVGDEIVAVIGLNGSGKTTTLRTISGLTPPERGRIILGDEVISGRRAHQIARAGIGYVQQRDQLFPELTVLENVKLGAFMLPDGEAEEAVRDSLGLFPILAEKAALRAGNLSGGERQMLAMAKTLAQRPKLLLLDEPTAGLSPVAIGVIFEVLASVRRRGLPIVMVEQNVARALDVADRVVVLYLGVVHAIMGVAEARADMDLVRGLMMGEGSRTRAL